MKRLTQLTVLALSSGSFLMLTAQPRARVVVPAANPILPMATTLSAISAVPATISFSLTDPTTTPSVAGNSAATVSWTTSGGAAASTWNLQVSAAAASFTNCATIPRSAVSVACGGVTGGTAGACGGGFTLSGVGQQIASGKEVTGGNKPYSVTVNFTLADSWSYLVGSSCSLSVTYTVTAP